MKFSLKTLTIAGAGLLLGGNLWAAVPEKYQTILDRNPFGLVPPPPPAPTEPTTKAPVNIFVTGFATIGGEKRVYFMIPPPPKEPGATHQYLSLSEGQREAGIEVISISEDVGEVRIKNGGVETLLSLKDNGIQPAKLPAATKPAPMPLTPQAQPAMQAASPIYDPNAPAAAPLAPPPPGTDQPPQLQQTAGTAPQPSQSPQGRSQTSGNNQSGDSPSVRTIPTRTLRVPPARSSPNPSPQSAISSPVYNHNPSGNYQNQGDVGSPAVDPGTQLANMREWQRQVDRNGGYINVEVPNNNANPAIAAPPTQIRRIPAPPLPPLPQ